MGTVAPLALSKDAIASLEPEEPSSSLLPLWLLWDTTWSFDALDPVFSGDPVFTHGINNPFGFLSHAEIAYLLEQRKFYEAIQNERQLLEALKERYQDLVAYTMIDVKLTPNTQHGISRSYILETDEQKFLIKPMDGDFGCINGLVGNVGIHPMGFFTSDEEGYLSTINDVLCWEIAEMSGFGDVTPEARLAIVSSRYFYDLSEAVEGDKRDYFIAHAGAPNREKLVSMQRFVPNAKDLFAVLQDLQMEELSDEEIARSIDQSDFEKAWALEIITGDQDGHFGNFLGYIKGHDAQGRPIYGIEVIDNSYALPAQYTPSYNMLSYLPNADKPPSETLKALIRAINLDEICQKVDTFDREAAKEALIQRVTALKAVIDEDLTLAQMYKQLQERAYEMAYDTGSGCGCSDNDSTWGGE